MTPDAVENRGSWPVHPGESDSCHLSVVAYHAIVRAAQPQGSNSP